MPFPLLRRVALSRCTRNTHALAHHTQQLIIGFTSNPISCHIVGGRARGDPPSRLPLLLRTQVASGRSPAELQHDRLRATPHSTLAHAYSCAHVRARRRAVDSSERQIRGCSVALVLTPICSNFVELSQWPRSVFAMAMRRRGCPPTSSRLGAPSVAPARRCPPARRSAPLSQTRIGGFFAFASFFRPTAGSA